eukprot:Amastigsp_a846478_57.p4 type:complete len:124 gc:universal Amastigsp_a846478_57:915-544(-)
MIFLLMFQILPQSWRLPFWDAPWSAMNSHSASTVRPRRMMPCTVGNRGSFQPSTMPSSTNHASFRLLKHVYEKLSREKSCTSGSRISRSSIMRAYCSLRRRYSFDRSGCVMFSIESTIGQAKS